MSSIESFFANVQLPSMPDVALALVKTLNNDEATRAEVEELIGRDAALTARLLRLANTAQFGLPRAVGTVGDAMALVGMQRVRNLALGVSVSGAFPEVAGLDRKEYWKSMMACAGYAQWIAGQAGINGQVAWLTGMMLRLGELLIAQADPQLLLEIERLPRIPGVRWQREKRLVGFTEGQITAELARRWNFPPQIVQALHLSAEPMTSQNFSRLGAIIHLAGLLAEASPVSADSIDQLPSEVMTVLTLDAAWMRKHLPPEDSFLDLA